MRPTCEILSEVLLQLYRLIKDFIGLFVRLPLIHFPEKDSGKSYFNTLQPDYVVIPTSVRTSTYIRASMDFGFIKMAIG